MTNGQKIKSVCFLIGVALAVSIQAFVGVDAAIVSGLQMSSPSLWNQNRDRIIALQNRAAEAMAFYPGMACGAYYSVGPLGEESLIDFAPCVYGGISYNPITGCPPGFSRVGNRFSIGSFYSCAKN